MTGGVVTTRSNRLLLYLTLQFPPKFETPIEIRGIMIWPGGHKFRLRSFCGQRVGGPWRQQKKSRLHTLHTAAR